MRQTVKHMLLLLIALAFLCGCKRIPLHERSTRVELKLNLNLKLDQELKFSYETELDEDFASKLDGKEPEYVEVLFYDKYTHQLLLSQIVGPYGGVLNVPAGDYHMVTYNFGTESTQVEDLYHRHEAEAFTSDITKIMSSKFNAIQTNASSESKSEVKGYENDPIIHEPDHLYVANKNDVNIPAFEGKEETVIIYADASTILEVYSLEVLNVKGVDNIEKVEAFITGQIKSNYFGKLERNTDPATLYVTLKTDVQNGRLYTIFGTFGKLPGEENKIYLDITVTDSDGGQYRFIYDVTDQFDDPDNTNHSLIIDGGDIDIPDGKTGGGGLAPSVDKWEDEIIDVPLG